MLQQVYKDHTLFRATVFMGHKRFKEGRDDVEYDPRCYEANVDLMKKMVRGDRRLTVRLISDELGLNRISVYFAQYGKQG